MVSSSSSQLGPNAKPAGNLTESKAEKDINHYLPLYKAAIRGDWNNAQQFFDLDPEAITARITKDSETVLHIAVARSEAICFVEKLIESMPTNSLLLTNKFGETALHMAAKYGNTAAAKLLVSRDSSLPHVWSASKLLAIHLASLFGRKETLLYLLTVTKDDVEPSPYGDQPGTTLINTIVNSGFYDVALDLLPRHPNLATTLSSGGNTPLSIIAGKPNAFPSGCCLKFWQRVIYSCVPLKLEKSANHCTGRVTSPLPEQHNKRMQVCWLLQIRRFRNCLNYELRVKFWKFIEKIVPHIKCIHDKKLSHYRAIELVKCLCAEVVRASNLKSALIYKPAIILGATLGIHEVVDEILKSFPSAIWSLDREHHDLFQIAVMNRRESIFNILYRMDEHTHLVTQNTDKYENNILHLAGKLAPPHRLNLVTGAALQMQRELQWYKEVEKFVLPNYKVKDTYGKTPKMVFTEEHKDLVAEGQQWLNDTAKSCSFAAVLIVTVAFASAITVPGGTNGETGIPIFQKEKPFVVFAIFNALSLLSSVTSLLMFLFILTSHCAEQDFLYSLPNKLIIGLVNLFLSITFMMIAFSAAIYVVFGRDKLWTIIPISALGCFPVALFGSLQYPLLVDMIRSTNGPGIFGKKGESLF